MIATQVQENIMYRKAHILSLSLFFLMGCEIVENYFSSSTAEYELSVTVVGEGVVTILPDQEFYTFGDDSPSRNYCATYRAWHG